MIELATWMKEVRRLSGVLHQRSPSEYTERDSVLLEHELTVPGTTAKVQKREETWKARCSHAEARGTTPEATCEALLEKLRAQIRERADSHAANAKRYREALGEVAPVFKLKDLS